MMYFKLVHFIGIADEYWLHLKSAKPTLGYMTSKKDKLR